MTAGGPAEVGVSIPTQSLGKWTIGPIVPAISSFSGAVTAKFASTFDYQASFICDQYGYRTATPDLAWVELWAADHGQTNYFHCGKVKALEVPNSGTLPTYTGVWSQLGEGRAYDLYVKYRLRSGDESQLSPAVIANVINLGLGIQALATNPNSGTPPTINSSSFVALAGTSASTGNYKMSVSITNPPTTGWIKSLAVYAVPHGGGIAAGTLPWLNVPFQSGGSYSFILPLLPFQLPTALGGPGGWDIFVAWEDMSDDIGATVQIASIPAIQSIIPVFVNSLMSLPGTIAIPLYWQNGAPGGLTPVSFPALYFRTDGAFTTTGFGNGSLIYIWDGTNWHNLC